MKNSELAEWRNIRREGAYRYILLTGILQYGLPLAVINLFVIPIAKGNGLSDVWSMTSLFILIICLLVGALYGVILWRFNEHKYKKSR